MTAKTTTIRDYKTRGGTTTIRDYKTRGGTTTIRDYKTRGSTNSFSGPLSHVAILSQSWNVVAISVATGIVITIVTKNSLVTLTYDGKPNCDAHNKL